MIDNSKEYILCAAIWYKELPLLHHFDSNVLPVNCDTGIVFCGYRHPHCMYSMASITGIRSVTPDCGTYIQGFLTSKNRFVDRYEALTLALNAGQTTKSQGQLFSEDIY